MAFRLPGVPDPRARFLEQEPVPGLEVVLSPDEVGRIDAPERPTVRATLVENGKPLAAPVGVKLKGAAGSSRPWGDLPALTIQVAKFDKKQRFHGMTKFHLNNSVQDPTRLHEWAGSHLFRLAGYPAPRVGHAVVRLNGRDVGLYVLKEGFDKGFLTQAFADPSGNLYEGGFVADIDRDLERDLGSGPEDRADLKALVAACREPNPERRRELLLRHLHVGAFLTFTTLERMLAHWDGYVHNTNNYRLYFDRRGNGIFLPHGMDQLFGDPGFPLGGGSHPIVASAVLGFPDWERLQRERVRDLEPLLRPGGPLEDRLRELGTRLEKAAQAMAPQSLDDIRGGLIQFPGRLSERHRAIQAFVDAHKPAKSLPPFTARRLPRGWGVANAVDGVRFEETKTALGIVSSKWVDTSTSWRIPLQLPMGEYVLRANVSLSGVVAADPSLASGVGIRISGGQRSGRAVGSGRLALTCPIRVDEPNREVILVLELRSATGKAWFARDSIVVERVTPPRVPIGKTPRLDPVPAPGNPPIVTVRNAK